MKKTFYCEAAYAIGLACLALSTALMATADFGVSMVVAPAYILPLKVSEFLPFFSFGMAEYLLQLVLIVFLAVVLRRVKLSYPASFATAVLYGFLLDGFLALVALLPVTVLAVRIAMFVAGFFLCAGSISLLFHTYVPPEAYELVVKEFSVHFGWKIHRVKTVYDCVSCAVAIALSLVFFGFSRLEGVGVGTLICTVCNGTTIAMFSRFFEKRWDFRDRFPLRRYFS